MNAAALIILIRVIFSSIMQLTRNQSQSCAGRSVTPEVVIKRPNVQKGTEERMAYSGVQNGHTSTALIE
jgi:hypothetical protein